MQGWLRRLLWLGRSKRLEDDLDAEFGFHLDMRVRALEAEGASPGEARERARREFGGRLQIREASRDVWIFRWLDQLAQDVRYAFRGWGRQPAFTAAVVGTLALGIGANTAIFSVVDAMLLRPAPFADASRLVLVHAARPAQHQAQLPLSFPNFVDLRARGHAFEGLAAWTMGEKTVTGQAEPEHVQSVLATANLFDVLGVRATMGRTFRADEDRPGIAPVVVISHSLWTRRFARDPHVLGATLLLDGEPHEIVGVLPEGFRFASHPHETELWLPFGLDKFSDRKYARGLSTMLVIGRLRAGLSLGSAQADVSATASSLEHDYPDNNRSRLMVIVPLEVQAAEHIRLALIALSGGVVLVLLVACANVVNLLLGRASARQHELAVRSVLGGSRRRIAGQLLVEYVLLALMGGGGGVLVARIARDLLVRLPYNTADVFTPWVAPLGAVSLNTHVLLFALASSLTVGLLVGVLPMWHAPVSNHSALAAGGARVTGQRRTTHLRSGLVVAEVALAVVLLTGMGLMLTTILRLTRVDPGFSPEGLTAIDMSLPASKYPGQKAVSFYRELLDRVRHAPGTTAAGAVEFLPFSGLDADTGVLFADRPIPTPDQRSRAHYRAVTDGYFEAMGIPMVAGRTFGSADRPDGPMVAILNETAARQLFPDGRAMGRRVSLDFEAMRFFPDRAPVFDLALGLREVVGIVKDVRHSGLTEDAGSEFYVPASQRGLPKMTVVVRSALGPADVLSAVRAIVTSLDPGQPVAAATTLPDLIAASMARPRFNTTIITAFGVLALSLAAIGIYGVMAHFVQLRTRDIGIHVAIGATPRDVFRMVTRQMLGLSAMGLAIGLAGAMAAGSGLSKLLFGVDPRDPFVLIVVTSTVLATASVATLVPTLRALRIDPARALRGD